MSFSIHSPAFADGSDIPRRYSKDGANLSPPLEWQDLPPNARSLALVVEDPDAPRGVFCHWGIYDIPLASQGLPEDAGAVGAHFKTALNDFGNRSYDGPQPPRGHGTHHYHFRCAALDVETLNLPQNASAHDLWKAAQPHAIAQTQMVGTFER